MHLGFLGGFGLRVKTLDRTPLTPIDTIVYISGGGVRSLLAELF